MLRSFLILDCRSSARSGNAFALSAKHGNSDPTLKRNAAITRAGFDSFVAAGQVGPSGRVVGVDMTTEMLEKSRATAQLLGDDHVEFREGLAEALPVDDGWADVVISNGVINLCPDKIGVYRQIFRVLKPGGRMTVADICVERPVPEDALRDIDLWTG